MPYVKRVNPLLTPEDRELLHQRLIHRKRTPPKNTLTWQCRVGPLRNWMLRYAEWLFAQTVEPSWKGRQVMANKFANLTIPHQRLSDLEAREDFQDYLAELAKGPLERARARMIRRMPAYVNKHWWAATKAQEAGDYKALAAIAEPILERVLPRKQEAVAATQVNITLSPGQLAGLQQFTPLAIEAETVEPPAADTELQAG